jgi:hypothetical protein
MVNTLTNGNVCAGWSVYRFVSIHEVSRAFQNDEVFILILMNVHGRAVLPVGDDLKHRISAVRVLRRHADGEKLSRCDFGPFALTPMTRSKTFGDFCLYLHVDLPK